MPIATFQGVQNGIFALCFSPSDVMLATGSGAQVSEIFDVETGNVLGRLHDHTGTVKTVEFSSFNEQIIVTGSRDGSIKIWDLRITGTQISQDGQPL
jgi:denticleless